MKAVLSLLTFLKSIFIAIFLNYRCCLRIHGNPQSFLRGIFFQSFSQACSQCIVNAVEKLLRLLLGCSYGFDGGRMERGGAVQFSPTNLQAPSLAACN